MINEALECGGNLNFSRISGNSMTRRKKWILIGEQTFLHVWNEKKKKPEDRFECWFVGSLLPYFAAMILINFTDFANIRGYISMDRISMGWGERKGPW